MVNESDAVAEASADSAAASSLNTAAAASALANTSASAASAICGTAGCGRPATLACPTCLSLQLTAARFCSQPCFTSAWKQHNAAVHRPAKDRLSFQPPPFAYTGPLRPHYVTPRRSVPAHIQRPDYAESGLPLSELRERGDRRIVVHSAQEVDSMRAVCRLGRLLLDYAHSLVRPGVTTEEIDRLLHERTLQHGAYPSTLNYNGFPKSCCTSVNETICQHSQARPRHRTAVSQPLRLTRSSAAACLPSSQATASLTCGHWRTATWSTSTSASSSTASTAT